MTNRRKRCLPTILNPGRGWLRGMKAESWPQLVGELTRIIWLMYAAYSAISGDDEADITQEEERSRAVA